MIHLFLTLKALVSSYQHGCLLLTWGRSSSLLQSLSSGRAIAPPGFSGVLLPFSCDVICFARSQSSSLLRQDPQGLGGRPSPASSLLPSGVSYSAVNAPTLHLIIIDSFFPSGNLVSSPGTGREDSLIVDNITAPCFCGRNETT